VKQLQELKLEFDSLNRRVGFLELQNNNRQNNDDDKKLLKTSLHYLEYLKQTNEMINVPNQAEIVEPKMTWQKRPARLFPLHMLR